MTRPRDHAITLDADLVFRFAAYLNRIAAASVITEDERGQRFEAGGHGIKDWGVFYSSAGDRTWAPVAPWGPDAAPHWTPLERELATVYDKLTPSQRRRLCQRAEAVTPMQLEMRERFASARAQRDASASA